MVCLFEQWWCGHTVKDVLIPYKTIPTTNTPFIRLKDDVGVEQPNQTDQNVHNTDDQSEDGGHLAARFKDSEEEENEGHNSQEHALDGKRLRHTLL